MSYTAASDYTPEPKPTGNPKKRKKARQAHQQPAISSLMDCYAQQRQQSQPGAWKADLEQQQEEEEQQRPVGGVLDKAMCGALGGGDLTKALSTAFKGAMAQAQFEVRERERERAREQAKCHGNVDDVALHSSCDLAPLKDLL